MSPPVKMNMNNHIPMKYIATTNKPIIRIAIPIDFNVSFILLCLTSGSKLFLKIVIGVPVNVPCVFLLPRFKAFLPACITAIA